MQFFLLVPLVSNSVHAMQVMAPIVVMLLLLSSVAPTLGAGATRQDSEDEQGAPRSQQEQERFDQRMMAERARQQRLLREMADRARSAAPTRTPTGVDENPARSIANALNDLMSFAAELEGLLDLRSTEVLDDRVRDELRTRSARSVNAARRVLEFIDRDSDSPPTPRTVVPDENLGDRLYRLAALYTQLVEPTVQLISGDVLNVGTLDEVRIGFTAMVGLIEAVPESELSVPIKR